MDKLTALLDKILATVPQIQRTAGEATAAVDRMTAQIQATGHLLAAVLAAILVALVLLYKERKEARR